MNKFLKSVFKGKNILITGGTGSIGSEIVRQLLQYKPQQIRIYSRDESKHFFLQQELGTKKNGTEIRYLIGDVRDKDRLEKAFLNIDVVFHAAALKHVPFCEYNPFEAIKTNVYGTQNLVDLAIKYNVKRVVAISTDKAVNPNTVMGITKLLMERIIVGSRQYLGTAKTKFSVVRFGNVLNSRGSVVPLWKEQIKKGGPVTVTDKKMMRFFMTIPEAVDLVFLATSKMLGEEVFVLKMEEQNIYEMAKKTIAEITNNSKIKIKITGIRDREKLTESLYTDEEEELMLQTKKFYIILPDKKTYLKRKNKYQ